MMNLGFLASHRGSNMQAVVDACRSGVLAAKPAVLICNNRQAEVVGRTEQQGIPVYVLNAATHLDPDTFGPPPTRWNSLIRCPMDLRQ